MVRALATSGNEGFCEIWVLGPRPASRRECVTKVFVDLTVSTPVETPHSSRLKIPPPRNSSSPTSTCKPLNFLYELKPPQSNK
jgi:hypothetical protein